MHKKSTFHFEFPASPPWFRTIRQVIITATQQCGFDDRTASQVAMATDEALCNIHKHGYGGDQRGLIELDVRTTKLPHPTICIELGDEGKQVELNSIRSRNLEDVRPGGLGVHLIQTIMDEAEWSHNDKGGMKLTMKKMFELETKTHALESKESNV